MNCHLSSAYLNNRHTDKWRGRHKLPTTGIQTSEEADINCQQQAYRQVKRQTWTANNRHTDKWRGRHKLPTTGIQTSEEADINCQQQAYTQVKRQTWTATCPVLTSTTGIQTSEEADMNCHLSSAYLNKQAYRQVKRQTWTATCPVLTSTNRHTDKWRGRHELPLVKCLPQQQAYRQVKRQTWTATCQVLTSTNRHTDKWRGRHELPTTGIQTSEEADMNCHLSSAYPNNRVEQESLTFGLSCFHTLYNCTSGRYLFQQLFVQVLLTCRVKKGKHTTLTLTNKLYSATNWFSCNKCSFHKHW